MFFCLYVDGVMTTDTPEQKTYFIPEPAWDNIKHFIDVKKPLLPIFQSHTAWAMDNARYEIQQKFIDKITREYLYYIDGDGPDADDWLAIWEEQLSEIADHLDVNGEDCHMWSSFCVSNWLSLMAFTNLSSLDLSLLLVREELLEFVDSDGHENGWNFYY